MKKETILGQKLTGNEERDAVHIAVAPATALVTLKPGEHVEITNSNGRTEAVKAGKHPIGIVDPFLTTSVKFGEQFYIFLYPNTITSLKHVWTHPDFEEKVFSVCSSVNGYTNDDNNCVDTDKTESVQWMEDFASSCDMSLKDMLAIGRVFNKTGQAYVEHGSDRCMDAIFNCGGAEEFWKHYEIITGDVVKDKYDQPFSCSC